jgi:hypothetical protein
MLPLIKPLYCPIQKEIYERNEVQRTMLKPFLKEHFGNGPENLCGYRSLKDAFLADHTLRNIRLLHWQKLNYKVFGIYEFMGIWRTKYDLPVYISPDRGIELLRHHAIFYKVNALPKFI